MTVDEYRLLKLVERVGVLRGRKRLQKTVFLLQQEGFPFGYRFFAHYYGPYSTDLAADLDALVRDDCLLQQGDCLGRDVLEYHYELTAAGRQKLSQLDPDLVEEDRRQACRAACRFEQLVEEEVWVLELAATMLYWRRWGLEWDQARQKTAVDKGANRASKAFLSATKLAETILAPNGN